MLEEALKMDRVHVFGDISKSQVIEKMLWAYEIAMMNDQKSAKGQKPCTFIAIISIGEFGSFYQTDKDHKEEYEQLDTQKFPLAADYTQIYKNFMKVSWLRDG